ncbi:hypothetical protein [Paenibacillus segetis]|uniref:Uncharacterized protein n=1 Tax=Paenibacillus segetis TaxID=1325360 RepID=A0ABQ1YMJ3_9BACL|nr:hypothetical protein [Paenibacillus segetis]GGH30090.1 hypothetical protein GCM10008013_32970 [Paenibacillus segetis]
MKWIGWLLKLSITIVMVSLLTVLTTGYVVNHYIGSLLSSYNIPVAAQAPSIGGIFKEMLGLGGGNKTKDTKDSQRADSTGKIGNGTVDGSVGTSPSGVDTSGDPSKGTTDQNKDNGKSTSEDTEQDIPEDALPVMGGITSGDSQQDQEIIVSPDDLVAKKDGLASTEKEEVFSMLMSKLPEEEMRKLTEAMEGGLTESEIFDIEQILSKYLDKEEYSKMMEILQK